MVMAQDRTTDDWKVCIGTSHIMWVLSDKIQKFAEHRIINLHWDMLLIEDDAMLVVIYIWRILQIIVLSIQLDRDYTVILSCRM